MNIQYNPASGLIDILLRDVAKRIQLPPSSYQTAVERYQTMDRHLNRESSAIKDMISRLYPQGSIAIGAVVSSKFDNDEFDVDAIVELHIAASSPPAAVLDLLHAAIAGEKGSRYHDMTRRQSRCVTVDYDSMHIDFTPAVLMPSLLERTSTIFHANENDHFSKHYHKVANPWGFGEWFKTQTPLQVVFAEDAALRKTAEPLPDFARINEKSLPLIALQMIKRWRNGRYTNRNGRRMPPSVMLSYYVAMTETGASNLFGEIVGQVRNLRQVFQNACSSSQLVRVENPACKTDWFTDRWPEDQTAQREFLADLIEFERELAKLADHPSLADAQKILAKLFGERATADAVAAFSENYGAKANSGGLHHYLGTGAAALQASGLSTKSYASQETRNTRGHTFFGGTDEAV
jgi:hypothetical protein